MPCLAPRSLAALLLAIGPLMMMLAGCSGVQTGRGYFYNHGNDIASYSPKHAVGTEGSEQLRTSALAYVTQQGMTITEQSGTPDSYGDWSFVAQDTDGNRYYIDNYHHPDFGDDGLRVRPLGEAPEGYVAFLDGFFAHIQRFEKSYFQAQRDAARVNDTVRTQTIPHRTHVPHHKVPVTPKGHY
ncbi:MAG: hypothetical protein AAGB34_03455 [Planctomycetota bacterium]